MTVKELIAELQEFSPELTVIGWNRGEFSDEPELSEVQVNIDEEGGVNHFNENIHEESTGALLIDFN